MVMHARRPFRASLSLSLSQCILPIHLNASIKHNYGVFRKTKGGDSLFSRAIFFFNSHFWKNGYIILTAINMSNYLSSDSFFFFFLFFVQSASVTSSRSARASMSADEMPMAHASAQ